MQQPTMNTLLLLALTTPLLASPLPGRDIKVRYTPNYANPPTPRSPTVEDDLSAITSTPSTSDFDDILSIPSPLPSSLLMNLAKLQGDGEEAAEQREDVTETPVVARGVTESVSDARHLCPIAGLVIFWALGFLACAIHRWRKPRGEIYLDVEKPQRSVSHRADEVSEAN